MERKKGMKMEDSMKRAEMHYVKGYYEECVKIYQSLCTDTTLLPFKARSENEDSQLDNQVLAGLLKNNLLVSKSLVLTKDYVSYESWETTMQSFLRLHKEFTCLKRLKKVALKYFLNIAYNTLWWGWWHPHGLETDRSHVDTCLELASDCFEIVLEDCNGEYISSSFVNNEDTLVHVLKRIPGCFHKLQKEEIVQLLEIIIIVISVLLELKPKQDVSDKCIDTVTSVLNMKKTLLMDGECSALVREKNTWESNFKFGLIQVNSKVEKIDVKSTMEVLRLCLCMCLIQVKNYSNCVRYLEDGKSSDTEIGFMEKYLKALACFHSDELEMTLLHLSSLTNISLRFQLKNRYYLLLGNTLSRMGKHNEALAEFFKILNKNEGDKNCVQFYPKALFHIANEYKALYDLFNKTSQLSALKNKEKDSVLLSTFQSSYLDSLQHLLKVLRDIAESKSGNSMPFVNPKLRIMNVLDCKEEINLSVALYLLGTAMEAAGDINTAADLFVELLSQPEIQLVSSLVVQIPDITILYHNAAVLLLKCRKHEQAESLCRQAVVSYRPKNDGMLSLEADLVSLLLLAFICKEKGKFEDESELLDRCTRLIINNRKEKATSESGTETVHLLQLFSAKLHILKADNYKRRGHAFRNDVLYELKHAVISLPGIEELKHAYILERYENGEFYMKQDITKLDSFMKKLSYKYCSKIAVDYILLSDSK